MPTSRREFLVGTGLALGAPLLACRASPSDAPDPDDPRSTTDRRTATVPIQLSTVLQAHGRGDRLFSVRSLDLGRLGRAASPVVVLDDFRVIRGPFGPHPHAGFSAVTYVFPDSDGGLRNRDSFGGHHVVGPGGLCWLQAGRGALHEELPSDAGRELHGLQIFVNLSARNKLADPGTFALDGDAVPEWHGPAGDRVRVAVGSFEGVASPLAPVEPFTLLDVALRREVGFSLPAGHNALVYVRHGDAELVARDRRQRLTAGQALAASGGPGSLSLTTSSGADVVILSGAELQDPVVARGPFIQCTAAQLTDAERRYLAGDMGTLAPYTGG